MMWDELVGHGKEWIFGQWTGIQNLVEYGLGS